MRSDDAPDLPSTLPRSMLVIVSLTGLSVRAASAFEDPKGRFSIDLPDGCC